jgi:hypothetical protein
MDEILLALELTLGHFACEYSLLLHVFSHQYLLFVGHIISYLLIDKAAIWG